MTALEATSLILPQGPHVYTLNYSTKPTKTRSSTIDSLDRSPDDVHITHTDNQSQPVYFTSDLNEGFANVEEITCVNTLQNPDTNALGIQHLNRYLDNYHASRTGDGVGYGYQMGNTSGVDQEETEDITGSNEESDDEESEELLTATPVRMYTEPPRSPLMFSDSIDISGAQSERHLSSTDIIDSLRESDSNESLYRIISDDSSDDGGILQHLPDFDLDLDTESEASFRSEGNIPNLQALGVQLSIKTVPPAPFCRSFSIPASSAKASSYHQGLITSSVSSKFSIRADKASTSTSIKNESNPKIHFCTTSTQSAIVEKIKFRRATIENDIQNIYKKYDLKQSSDKTTKLVKDSDRASHSTTSKEDLVEDVDYAFEASVRESSVLPILKQELKYKIQVDRMKRGEPEVVLQPEQPKEYKVNLITTLA